MDVPRVDASDTELALQLLEAAELPPTDLHDFPSSPLSFEDGGKYRVEISSVEGPDSMRAVLDAAEERGIAIHRVSQGSGITLLSDVEIVEMAELGAARCVEVSLFIGPRGPWEGTAQSLTPDGKLTGWRHSGIDQLRYALTDLVRALRLGIRGVLVADEGLAAVIARGRQAGLLPNDLVVKGSAFLGASNPAGIRLLVESGIDTINVASDSSLARLAALRAVVPIPIDLYIEAPDGLGGFTRYHEVPEIVRVAAPVHLKFGLRNAPNIYPSGLHLRGVAVETARERVRRASLALEHLERSGAMFAMSELTRRAGVPVVQQGVQR